MNINVGSKNPQKVGAVEELAAVYDIWQGAEIVGFGVSSAVSDQPLSLEETVRGAINRAKAAFGERECVYAVGLESGLMEIPYTKSGYMDFCACAIYDGANIHLGFSSCFEYPPKVVQLVKERGLEIDGAVRELGITDNPRIGYAEGMIGYLTQGRVSRKEYTKQSIQMALIHLENKEWY